jgi:hypothetical protein
MVVVSLEFTVTISPLRNFALKPYISIGVVNKIGFEETTPTKIAFKPLRGML